MQDVLHRLKEGVRTFQRDVYPARAEEYQRAAREPQQPHTLMITCADSRIDIETITNAQPGELFITRNVGNMVPAYGEMLGGVSAVIEYAVSALKVRHVVVCGHSDCGAMKALEHPEALASLPAVSNWLKNAHAAVAVAHSLRSDDTESPAASLRRLTERNVLLQMQHLKTHPAVAGAMARGELDLSGWIYELGSGSVRVAADGRDLFEEVEPLADVYAGTAA